MFICSANMLWPFCVIVFVSLFIYFSHHSVIMLQQLFLVPWN